MNKASKFSALFEQRDREEEQQEPVEAETERKQRGRPRGKRSDSEYAQVTAYVPRDVHKKVKIALIEDGNREFSELIERLLEEWLSNR